MYLVAVNLENPREMAIAQAKDGRIILIGRKPESLPEEPVDVLRISWNDRLVSRNHCEAMCTGESLQLNRLPALPGRSKPNALYSNEAPRDRELMQEPVTLNYGSSAVIGTKGNTAIYWLKSLGDLDSEIERYQQSLETEKESYEAEPITRQDYDEVEQLDEYSLRLQLKLLQRELPEQVLSGWTNETDLFTRAAVFLENALPGQKGVSATFVALDPNDSNLEIEVLNPDPLARADFRPSRTLLKRLNIENPEPADIHIWSSKEHSKVFSAESLGDKIDWVCILPVASLDESAEIYRDEHRRPIYLYVETRQASETTAAAFVPFLRLISSLVASLLSSRADQKLQDQMATYFSPGLRKLMQRLDQTVLEPAMVDVTVMFADRRGHSRMLELARSDHEILDRLNENQGVVGLITEEVFNSKGVVTDFAGDGALGLWGWPNIEEEKTQHSLEAVEAAEAIIKRLSDRVEYEEELGRDMSAVRIGISTGRIAVGKTGPTQQWHISVFGSVANLGARLERIAKEFRIPILISDETYLRIEGIGNRRFRRLCQIRPVGFEESYPIHELILPKSQGGSGISDEDARTYETALELFHQRKWNEALDLLETLPEGDPPTAWLIDKTESFRQDPPASNWGGEIQSLSK
ncbi:MAG: adenylate/guanylate cyclase domain-containing protein [Verrucomicrobiota bacterium]|nr:adenylate/guanylate cyclase domain-containing protein [Verrucomicrobiota bacterium]